MPEALIGEGVHVVGEVSSLSSDEELIVAGRVDGKIRAGLLTIRARATIDAEVVAERVVIEEGGVLRGTACGRRQGSRAWLVAGQIEGTVSLEATVTVEKSGRMQADVEAEEVIIRGVLIGHVRARRAVRIEAGAQVKGDVEAPAIAVDDGAQVIGELRVGELAERAVHPRYEADRVAEAEVIMRPVLDGKRRVVVKKRT